MWSILWEPINIDWIFRPNLTSQELIVINFDESILFNTEIKSRVHSEWSFSYSCIKNRNVLHVFLMEFINELIKTIELQMIISKISIVKHVVNISPLNI